MKQMLYEVSNERGAASSAPNGRRRLTRRWFFELHNYEREAIADVLRDYKRLSTMANQIED